MSVALKRLLHRSRLTALLVCALLVCALFDSTWAVAQTPTTNYDESKVGAYTLPDPLIFNNGKPVRSARDWKRRRSEIVELFAANVYGHSPKAPKHISYEVFDIDKTALGGKAVRKQVTIYFSENKNGPREDLLIYIPAGARKPVPMFLTLNFSGNQSVINDPGIKLPTIWEWKTHVRQQARKNREGRTRNSQVEKILARGYGFATICYQNIEPDFKGGYVEGIRPLFFKSGQTEPTPDDWGAIGAWAYGLSRAMDYLEKDRDVDAKQRSHHGTFAIGQDCSMGWRTRYPFRHGDLKLFGRGRRVALAAQLWRNCE